MRTAFRCLRHLTAAMSVDLRPITPAGSFLQAVLAHGLTHSEEPVTLSSGTLSRDFVDVKRALAAGPDLDNAAKAVLDKLDGLDFDAVGGLTLGADHIGAAVAMRASVGWFVVRKEPKAHGLGRSIEGTPVGEGTRVVLIEDVISKGGSILKAHDAVIDNGAAVVAAIALVDRGNYAQSLFAERNVPYHSVLTYKDLSIDPL